ncbi:MAG: DUF262 domain-containing protein [bacterium]
MATNTSIKELSEWEVKSNTSDMKLKSICSEIESGNIDEGGINLKPYYQREYKFTKKDESLLIESLLAGIPIPIIYLASDTTKVPHVSNVIDGQHRLMAVYRFINNKFSLTGLEKLTSLNDKKFYELDATIQNKLLHQTSLTLQYIHIQDDPELELEIFTRYNKGTNPLTPQEIRNVVYGSKFNDWVNDLVETLKSSEDTKEIYNISTNRYNDKRVHAELHVLFAIFKYGIKEEFYSSTEYTDLIMKKAREMDDVNVMALKKQCKEFFDSLTKFMKKAYYEKGIQNPFSKEIYKKVKKRNHKFQTSIMMIMVPIYNYILNKGWDLDKDNRLEEIVDAIRKGFNNSEFPEVTSSTTRPALILSTVDSIKSEIDNLS